MGQLQQVQKLAQFIQNNQKYKILVGQYQMRRFQKGNDLEGKQTPILIQNKNSNALFKATIFLKEIYKKCRKNIQIPASRKRLTNPSTKNEKHPELNINNEFNYIFFEGDHIINQKKNITYTVNGLFGKGTFGQVLSCVSSTGYKMAIKVIKNQPAYKNQGLMEVKLLREIAKYQKKIGGSNSNYLNVFDAFIWNNHVCTAMQIMDNSLLDILRQANYQGLQMKWILLWTKKLLFSLSKIHKLGIIHNDIKPQNIMFRPQRHEEPLLIDFSSSCYAQKQYFTYIQSRFYRAPEVIMKMTPYSPKIDVWSLGCLLAQIYLGLPLFPGTSSFDQLRKILKLSTGYSMTNIGRVPTKAMIEKSQEGKNYFTISTSEIQEQSPNPIINLKSDDEYFKVIDVLWQDTGTFTMEGDSYFQFQSVDDFILHINPEEQYIETHKLFIDLLKRMLVLDPDERISAEEAYLHPFTGGTVEDFEQTKNQGQDEKQGMKVGTGNS